MKQLLTQPNLDNPDDFYAELLAMHTDKNELQSQEINAKLILLLANHIGDRKVLREAMNIAKKLEN